MSEPQPVDFASLPEIVEGSRIGAEWWIAWGHLRSRKREGFVSLVTFMAIIGVMAGVALLNCVLAVMTGFEQDLREKILGANSHIAVFHGGGRIHNADQVMSRIDAVEGVHASAPFVYAPMMVSSGVSAQGVRVKGIHPTRTAEVTHVRDDLVLGYGGALDSLDQREAVLAAVGKGELPAVGLDGKPFTSTYEPPLPGALIGDLLADQLMVGPGDQIRLVNPAGSSPGLMGTPVPQVKKVRVAGVFDSGHFEFDGGWLYVDNALLQDMLRLDEAVHAIEVRVEDPSVVEVQTEAIERVLGPDFDGQHWKEVNSELFAALALEKHAMGLILQMVVVNAGLLIITTLLMMMLTKGREIAILKAMGAAPRTILRIFLMEGAAIGAVGTVTGTLLGLAGCGFLTWYDYDLPTDVYYVDSLPVVVDPLTVVTIAVAGFTTSFLCALYPAWRASRLDPVEALRYE